MKAAALLILALLSLPVHAQTWLSVGEHMAWVSQNNSTLVGSEATSLNANQKWLLDKNGVRRFGEDKPIINQCLTSDLGAVFCDNGDDSLYHFILGASNIFKLIGVGVNDEDGTFNHYIVMGKCSQISD